MGVYWKDFKFIFKQRCWKRYFYFSMMSIWRLLPQSCSHSTVGKAHYKWTVRSTVEVNIANERLLVCVQVFVETLNLEISRCQSADYAKEMYLKVDRDERSSVLQGTCCSGKTCVVHTEAICSRDKITWNEGFGMRASFVKVNWCVGDWKLPLHQ